jgi:hypothetical protein
VWNYLPTLFFLKEATMTTTPIVLIAESGTISTGAPVTTAKLPPVTQPISFTCTENKPYSGTVLNKDTDPSGLALSVTPGNIPTPAGGLTVLNANGTFVYTPPANFIGSDMFTYVAVDSAGLQSVRTTVSITVAAPPVVIPTIVTVAENIQTVTINNFTIGQSKLTLPSILTLGTNASGQVTLNLNGVAIVTFVGGNVTATTPLSQIFE